jgi:hypothetical protein
MREAADELARLGERVGDSDEQQYRQAKWLLAAEAEIPRLAEAVATAQAVAQGDSSQSSMRAMDDRPAAVIRGLAPFRLAASP